ncbi:MAG: hypothetical protein HRT44_03085 [Bdellovibrionales bacterium]|nr:hypothetical protein [Bdellovibrionales bacterium]NQZ18231.1 hypothetical protein [Bdellovibrionales bacterium]
MLRLVILLVILSSIPIKVFAFENCGYVKKKSLGYRDIDEKANGVIFQKSILIPILSEQGKYYQVKFKGEEFFIKKRDIKTTRANMCVEQYQCFKMKRSSPAYRSPSFKSEKVRVHKKGDELNWTGKRTRRLRGKRVKWSQVLSEGEYLWIPSSRGDRSQGACLNPNDKRDFFVEIDYSFLSSVVSDPYSYLITSIPDPSNVTCLQNPLVQGVDAGSGHRVGFGGHYLLGKWVGLRAGVYYETITYNMQVLDNPHPDPGNTSCALITVDVNSLSGRTITIKEDNVVIPAGVFVPLRLGQYHHIFLSGNLSSTFNLDQDQTFDFFTGQTLSKQTLNQQTIGVDSFRTFVDVELKYIWGLPVNKSDTLGVSLSVRASERDLSFGLGVLL